MGFPVDIGGSPHKNYNSISSSNEKNSVNNSLSPRNYQNNNYLSVNNNPSNPSNPSHASNSASLKPLSSPMTNESRTRNSNYQSP